MNNKTIDTLFETSTVNNITSTRGLPGTAELTNLATSLAHSIIKAMDEDIEAYKPRIQESANDSKEMDALISELCPEYDDKADFLKDLSDETIDGILKSQQSKRSRAKSKAMTLDNYTTLMTAAIAENIIRAVTGRAKTSGGFRSASIVDYTPSQLEELAANQDALRREIRNVQSKKSIMKSKADFDETDERWQALVKAEQMLKDLRVAYGTQIVEVDHTKQALAELFTDVDINGLKSQEAHELLETISKLLQD